MTILPPAFLRRSAVLLSALAVLSCTKDAGVNDANAPRKKSQVIALSEAAGAKALEDRYSFSKGDIKRDKNGNFVGGKRSEYDGKRNIAFGGGVGTASYKKSTYKAGAWSGNTTARTSPYAGKTDGSRFHTPSKFQGTSASQNAQRSRFEGSTARTSAYKAGNATENTGRRLEKPTDGWTDFRRRVFPEPDIMSKADYERMTVEQTRSILGRTE